jgi:3D-(3,5/4)-trihydroxycyclohexane-1,2-dione acylhydrolase (decyclizing)
VYAPDGEGWWDVPVAEVSRIASTQRALEEYRGPKSTQRPLLG